MYSFTYDKNAAAMVGVLRTTPYFNEDEDYAILLDSIAQHIYAGRQRDSFKFILVVDEQVPMPNATWRRRFAKSRSRPMISFYFAVVTSSALLRGVLTMVNWVSPPPEGSATTSVATFEEAVGWMEQRLARRLPVFKKLYEEASVDAMFKARSK